MIIHSPTLAKHRISHVQQIPKEHTLYHQFACANAWWCTCLFKEPEVSIVRDAFCQPGREENMLWLPLLLLLPQASSSESSCGRLEIPAETAEYNITSFVDECTCTGCARKCCADGFSVRLQEQKCRRDQAKNSSFPIYDHTHPLAVDRMRYFHSFLSCPSYYLEPNSFPYDAFFLQSDGRLWLRDSDKYKNVKEYCVDYVDVIGFTAFVCFEDEVAVANVYRRFNEIST